MRTRRHATALCKTAIAVPSDVLAAIDRAARERNESRTRFIVRVLRAAVRARRDADITRRLNDLFADEALPEEDRSEAEDFRRAGVDGSEERW